MGKILLICKSKKSFDASGITGQTSYTSLCHKEIEELNSMGYEFEYFAHDTIAGQMLNEMSITNKVAIGVIPKVDLDCWNKYFSDDEDIIPASYIHVVQRKVICDRAKVKYPRVTEFKTRDEFLDARRTALRKNIKACTDYYVSTQDKIIWINGDGIATNPSNFTFDGDGKSIICIDTDSSIKNCYYGGSWIERDTMKTILSMEV